MKVKSISGKIANLTNRSKFMVKKHSPEILLVAGITGLLGGAVLACCATLKAKDVMDEHYDKLDQINDTWEQVKEGHIALEVYSEQDHKKDLTVVYVQTSVNFIKLYGPAVTLGALSIACIVGGHGILKKRNVALMAAYRTLEEGFKLYRKRVVEEFGEEKDYMLKHGLKYETVTETEVDSEGKTKKVKKNALAMDRDPNSIGPYARYFDETCSQWSKNAEYNMTFLRHQQNYFNDMLKARGHVFLNEVYDALGFERTQAAQVVGWVIGDGDNYVDFGLYSGRDKQARKFVNGYERSILLDFNVDGVIFDMI